MRSDNLLVYLTPRRECTSQVHESIYVSVYEWGCARVPVCVCLLSGAAQVASWRLAYGDQRLRVRSKMEHSMDSQCGRAMCSTPFPLSSSLPAFLCGVCIYLLVNKTVVYIHSTAQRSPSWSCLGMRQTKRRNEGGAGDVLLLYSQVVSLARHFLLIDVMWNAIRVHKHTQTLRAYNMTYEW